MSVKSKQSLSINNKLAMTQQIQLAIKLLQLNANKVEIRLNLTVLVLQPYLGCKQMKWGDWTIP